MLIRGYSLKEETVKEIGRFAILWNCFERDYCANNCSMAKIVDAVQNIQIPYEKQCEFAKELNKRRGLFDQIIPDYVENSLHPANANKSAPTYINIMEDFMKQEYGDIKDGCLLIIYRLRSNLMHGLKMVTDLDCQIDLFIAANEVLESIERI